MSWLNLCRLPTEGGTGLFAVSTPMAWDAASIPDGLAFHFKYSFISKKTL
jgi:hypothetical protein